MMHDEAKKRRRKRSKRVRERRGNVLVVAFREPTVRERDPWEMTALGVGCSRAMRLPGLDEQ